MTLILTIKTGSDGKPFTEEYDAEKLKTPSGAAFKEFGDFMSVANKDEATVWSKATLEDYNRVEKGRYGEDALFRSMLKVELAEDVRVPVEV